MGTTGLIKSIGANAAILLLLISCTRDDMMLTEINDAIVFSPQITRSAVSSLGEGDSFAVWARESREEKTQTILSQEEVYCRGNVWSYDNLRYWKAGATYDFYALYPHDIPNAEFTNVGSGESPQIIITDFDVRNSADLMTAEQTDIAYTGNPSPVIFTFRHLLSKVEIVGRTDPSLAASGISVRLVSASLYGMPANGSCLVQKGDYGIWTPGSSTTAETPFCSASGIELNDTGISVFGELLPIPQAINDEYILEIVYEYTDPNNVQTRISKIIRLIDAGVSQWEHSTGYRYSFTLGSDYIIFDKPEVAPWNSASGGIVTVE